MSLATAATEKIFAANRAEGRIALAVAAQGGVTRRVRVDEQGSLRVRFPGGGRPELEAILVNTAGGMAGGDRFDIALAVGEGGGAMGGTTARGKNDSAPLT